jgi:hypothetical protein
MAHYAWLDKNNIVINVTVGVDENITQQGVGGSSEAWETFYTNAVNQEGVYLKRTSYNGNIRKNYAGIGYTYDAARDAFIPPKPFNSWVLDEATCRWQAPTPKPTTEGKRYYWSEDDLSWRITNE